MTTYLVAIDIWSASLTRDQASEKMGLNSNETIDRIRAGEEPKRRSNRAGDEFLVFRYASTVPKESSLEEHLADIARDLSITPFMVEKRPYDCSVYLEIGVLSYTKYGFIRMPTQHLQLFSSLVDDIVVTYYPCRPSKKGKGKKRKSK